MKDKEIKQTIADIYSNINSLQVKVKTLDKCLDMIADELRETTKIALGKTAKREEVIFKYKPSDCSPGYKTEMYSLTKFRKGEWVRYKGDGKPYEILAVDNKSNPPLYQIDIGQNEIVTVIDSLWWFQECSFEEYTPKDGEYVAIDCRRGGVFISIVQGEIQREGKDRSYAVLGADKILWIDAISGYWTCNVLRPATPEEIKQLDDALAKEGKKWDADKKALVDVVQNNDEVWNLVKDLIEQQKKINKILTLIDINNMMPLGLVALVRKPVRKRFYHGPTGAALSP